MDRVCSPSTAERVLRTLFWSLGHHKAFFATVVRIWQLRLGMLQERLDLVAGKWSPDKQNRLRVVMYEDRIPHVHRVKQRRRR